VQQIQMQRTFNHRKHRKHREHKKRQVRRQVAASLRSV
jgi:hypothetical protein